jgi:hypothetical protein
MFSEKFVKTQKGRMSLGAYMTVSRIFGIIFVNKIFRKNMRGGEKFVKTQNGHTSLGELFHNFFAGFVGII